MIPLPLLVVCLLNKVHSTEADSLLLIHVYETAAQSAAV